MALDFVGTGLGFLLGGRYRLGIRQGSRGRGRGRSKGRGRGRDRGRGRGRGRGGCRGDAGAAADDGVPKIGIACLVLTVAAAVTGCLEACLEAGVPCTKGALVGKAGAPVAAVPSTLGLLTTGCLGCEPRPGCPWEASPPEGTSLEEAN